MITGLKILFSAVLLFMCYMVISTSLENNLFEQWKSLGAIPWMRATLWDFYANVLVLSTWICIREHSLWKKITWIVLLVCLGSIGTCSYVLVQLFSLKPGDSLQTIIGRKK